MTDLAPVIAQLRRLFFYQSTYHAEQYRKANGDVGYSPACDVRFSDACRTHGYRCDGCPDRALTPLTDERLEAHLRQRITLGAYQLRDDGTAGWLCWDVDADQDTAQAKENVALMARLIVAKCRQLDLPVYAEWTGNKGIHLWVFVPDGCDAALLRRLGLWVVASIEEDEGTFEGIHVETFPKQTTLRNGDFGNLVKVPLSKHKKTNRLCLFVDPETLRAIGKTLADQHTYLLGIETTTAQVIADAVADWVPSDALREALHPETPRARANGHGPLSRLTRDFLAHGAGVGERNDRLYKAVCDLAGNSYAEHEVLEMVMEPALASGLERDEILNTVASAMSRPRSPSVPDSEPGDDGDTTLSDLRNGRRFVERHGANLRYCPPLGGWLAWDGQRWAPDESGQAMRWAKETVLEMYALLARMDDDKLRNELRSAIIRCESMTRLRAMVEAAESELDVRADVAEFDADPWLLNVANGTIDLRTGELREHRRDDMLTKLAPIVYRADAQDPVFDAYLAAATQGNTGFADYLQKAAGYTLTGLTDEETVFLVLGPGATGKSTLVEALLAALGDYATKTSFDTFLVQRNVGGARPDLVAIRGARMVAAVEPEKERRLATALIKELSGGDTISARALYKPPFSFRPTFKLWLAANAAPEMDDDDTGLWRRLLRLPFEHVIPEDARDPQVKTHLMSPDGGQAVLAWAVEGCLRWQREKLRPPDVVRRATAELRREFDPLAEFFTERCVVDAGAECEAEPLRRAYEEWTRAYGAQAIGNRDWGRRLKDIGCQRMRKRSMGGPPKTWWKGIGLLADVPDDEDGAGFYDAEPLPF